MRAWVPKQIVCIYIFLAPPSEMSVSKMATTAQDCVCCDADIVVPGVQDDAICTGDNANISIGDNANIDVSCFCEVMNFISIPVVTNSQNAEPCLGLEQDTPRNLSCSMLQEENPIISDEELQEIEAGDSGCPVQQYSVEDGGDRGSGKPINSSHFSENGATTCPKRKQENTC